MSPIVVPEVVLRGSVWLLGLALCAGPGFAAPPDASAGDARRMIRVPLEDVPKHPLLEREFDPCATEPDEQGRRCAVLFLDPEEVAQLGQAGIAFHDLGNVADHVQAFMPRNTLRARGPIASLRSAVGAAAMDRIMQEVQREAQPEADGPTLTYDRYHSLQEGTDFINALAAAYPQIAQVVGIGTSLQGRTVWALKITDQPGTVEPDEERILFTATTHAREWASHEAVLYIAEYLTSRYAADADVQRIVDNAVVWLIPSVNPDGYDYTWTTDRLWRKNRRDNPSTTCDGVDINRNYDDHWNYDSAGSSGDPCSNLFRGAAAASEPETQAIQALTAAQKFAITVNFHTYGQLVLHPWGYTDKITTESAASLRMLGKKYADLAKAVHNQNYRPGPSYWTIYPMNGEASEYAYGQQGALAITPELRPVTSGQGGFLLPEAEILPNNEENLAAALWLMKNVADARPINRAGSPTLIESPADLGLHYFSLPLTPVNQKPAVSIGYPPGFDARLQAWLNDPLHVPAVYANLNTSFVEGCGAGSGYRLDLVNDPDLLNWTAGLTQYKVLPYIFENGAEVPLSNVGAGMNLIGVPSAMPVHLQDVSVIKRVVLNSQANYGETIQEQRTAAQDLAAASPWINWTWTYTDPAGGVHLSHPTDAGGASPDVEPFRSYAVQVNVASSAFSSTSTPVYLLKFPPATVPPCLDPNDADGDGVPDDCDQCPDTIAGVSVDLFGCPTPALPPDLDRDGDVDLADYGLLQACYSGAGAPQNDPACQFARLDLDSDVDAADADILITCMSGKNVPADPGCL